jgi:hypothetical protein
LRGTSCRPLEYRSRFGFDYQLVSALLDWWRLETHSFHFLCREMAVTLEDVALLFRLPCPGDPPESWGNDILAEFAEVVRRSDAPEVPDFTNSHGPTCAWLRKYSVRISIFFFIVLVFNLSLNFEIFQALSMRDNTDEQTSNRHLEAYLLWLIVYVMFCGSQGNVVLRFLIPHVRRIANAIVQEMPQINWGAAVLAATYRGLCVVCTKTGTQPILLGCPLLLHLPGAGGGARPSRQVDHGVDVVLALGSYFELTSLVSYLKVMQVIELTHSLVYSSLGQSRPGGRTWTSSARSTPTPTVRLSGSHTPTPWLSRVHHRALLSLCFRDRDFWMTKTPLVHDMYVEEYLYQASSVPVAHTIDPSVQL